MIDKRWVLPHLMPWWWFLTSMVCVGAIVGAAVGLLI